MSNNTPATANQNNPPAPPRTRVDVLKGIMKASSVQEQFNNVLKENASSFMASIIDLYNGTEALQKCDPTQVVMEALKAATLKLPINKNLGFAYIVPFKGTATMIIGYKGLIQLAMRTGQYRFINADKVFEGEFRSRNKLTGEFDLNGEKKSDKVVGYFAYFETLNGFSKTLYMEVEAVHAHAKKYSPSYAFASSPWKTEFDDMAIKTVLRGLLSVYGFLSVDMISAFNEEPEYDGAQNNLNANLNQHANKENMTFDDAEVVDDKKENPDSKPADECPI